MLNDDGSIILEFGGENQLEHIISIFSGYKYVIHNDFSNRARVIELLS